MNDDNYDFIFNGAIIDIFNSYELNRLFIKIIDEFCQTATQYHKLSYYKLVKLKLQKIRFSRDKNLSDNEILELKKIREDVEKLENFTQKQVYKIIYWKNIAGLYERQKKNFLDKAEAAIDLSIQCVEEFKKNIDEEKQEELTKINENHLHQEAYCYRRKGLILQRKGQRCFQESEKEEYFKASLAIFQKTLKLYQGLDLGWNDLVLGHLGEIWLKLGEVQKKQGKKEAVESLQEAKNSLEECYRHHENQEFKNWNSLSIILNNLFQTCFNLEEKEAANEYLIKKYEILINKAEYSNNKLEQIFGLNELGLILLEQKKFEEAQENFKQSIKISQDIGNTSSLIVSQANLGRSYLEQVEKPLRLQKELSSEEHNLKQKLLQKAEEVFQGISEEIQDLPNKKYHVLNLNYLAKTYAKKGWLNKAEKYLYEAIEIDKKSGDDISLIKTYNVLSTIYEEHRKWNKRKDILLKVINLNKKLGEQKELSISLINLAKTFGELNCFETAIKKIEESIVISQELNDEDQLCISIKELVDILKKQNNLMQMVEILQKHYDSANQLQFDRLKKLINRHCKNSLGTIRGRVKNINVNMNFGHITSDDLLGEDVFFGRRENSNIFEHLRTGTPVEFQVSYVPDQYPNRKWRTNNIRII